MSAPAWKTDFPVSVAEDDFVARREFTRSLVWVSFATFLASAGLLGRVAASGSETFPAAPIARVDDMPAGSARVFHYPEGSDEPRVLVRLPSGEFAAFSQNCTHLGCPVLYESKSAQLLCPCHEGCFDARTGTVVSGPPPRALEQVALEVRGGDVWAVGVLS
jgi:nitrite reductase/ring-hydroxylating ferredoxin subunit